ncbi:HAD family hydrolase [Massilia cavernae]|uniref:HAD family phosphatase n=1 Tax=Massilia cavernae TaxID=2320864 RepID=A0A418Y5U8_9BURK|nr:HAD family phosphatase [Massilia cavernae]RJG22377.1 HAD family phosphatase [Massilia cavernae]
MSRSRTPVEHRTTRSHTRREARIKAILWDNDGVLCDTERLFFEANRSVLGPLGIALTREQYVAWYLEGNHGAWHVLRERGYDEARIAQVRVARDDAYSRLVSTSSSLCFPGVEQILARLAQRVSMSIVTASFDEHITLAHRANTVLEHIDHIVARTDRLRPKPHPDAYLYAMDKLGLHPDECIAVEDSPRGLAAARASGLRCIVLRTELLAGHAFMGAYRVVDSHRELEIELDALLENDSTLTSHTSYP